MRINQPVTQREHQLADHATLMSTTDTQSRITYANAAFVEASGYSQDELHGQLHNLVRHPDMPPEAFADMWATLRAGEPWTGLVKNRRKNGDHYWVRANAIPVARDGATTGFMSVRTTPTREDVTAAETLYRDFRAGKAGRRRFHKGLVLRGGLRSVHSIFATLPVRWRIRCAFGLLVPALAAGSWALGAQTGLAARMTAMAAALAAAGSWWLERQVARPLERMRDEALKVARGETREVSHLDRVDEIGMTLRTIGQLGLMFRWIVDDVSGQVLHLQTATSEIAQGNHDLSTRTEQSAASVQQTASSMWQMTATVQSNADTASQVNALSGDASEAAARGGRAVAQVVSTMNEITTSSRRIADIISVIDGIAFQTNILALNAAVEAARAGEQGRGFAVVAGEVRSLAQRSADAAHEIKALIAASVDRVESGARTVDEAGRTMDDIVAQVERVSGLIAGISAATREQSQGLGQVDSAVAHLDQITQQNAALVEQSAAASESLRQQTVRLAEAVSVFR